VSKLARQPETGTGTLQLDLARRLVAEALGTGLLVVTVIGSGAARCSSPSGGTAFHLTGIAVRGADHTLGGGKNL
jgi:hypothetical protein